MFCDFTLPAHPTLVQDYLDFLRHENRRYIIGTKTIILRRSQDRKEKDKAIVQRGAEKIPKRLATLTNSKRVVENYRPSGGS